MAKKTERVGITASKSGDFSEWYTQVVLKAELADYAPVKGLMVVRPDGYSIWESLRATLDAEFARAGVRNAFVPTLIPESLLSREAEHFAGFTPEVYWVTRSGDSELGDRLALRPTSETVAYEMYARWVKSWRDLPLKINFWNTALRAEIKSTKPFVRTSEFLWQEGHTVHATAAEAEEQAAEMLRVYASVIRDKLAIPVIAGKKSERERFVGAVYTTAVESIMPDGRALQMGTSHFLGQNFSVPFGIRYSDRDNVEQAAWQTSWGVSWRLIGAMIMVHGDDRGLVLPPAVAPVQAVIVPIHYSPSDEPRVAAKARELLGALEAAGLRARVDDRRELTPGFKFNDWEMRGVPVRVEVGPKDLESGSAVVATRHDGAKERVPFDKIASVGGTLERVQAEMLERAESSRRSLTRAASTYAELEEMVGLGGFVEAPWCGSAECEERVKTETGAEIRVIPFEASARAGQKCAVCGADAQGNAPVFARGY